MTDTAATCVDYEHFQQYGYWITPKLFTDDYLQTLRTEAQRLWGEALAEIAAGRNEQMKTMITTERAFIGWAHERSDLFAEFYLQDRFLEVVQQMLGPDADICGNQLVLKGPSKTGTNTFAWHQDSFYADKIGDWDKAKIRDDRQHFQCWVALTDATAENGALRVIPGGHREGILPHGRDPVNNDLQLDVDESKAVLATMEAGQMLLFSGMLPHASGANSSDGPRMALQMCVGVPGTLPTEHRLEIMRDGKARR